MPGPETKGWVSPRPGCCHGFCRLAVSPQTPFVDCSSAFISCFNASNRCVYEVTSLTLAPLCTYNLKYAILEEIGVATTSLDGSFPWPAHPLQLKVTGLHSSDSRTPK